MIWIYIFMITLAALPLILTIVRMRKTVHIKKNGIHVNATVRDIRTIRTSKSSVDVLTMEYKERATGRSYYAKATVTQGKYRIGDSLSVAYLPNNPSKYAVEKTSYWIILIFCIILFLFILFAVYKIDEMVKTGNMS